MRRMKTMIRIEKSSILKMTAIVVDGQCENDLFGYDNYKYLNQDDFEALITLNKLISAFICLYVNMILFNKIKYGQPKRDHVICSVSLDVISLSNRKGKSKNIDDASGSVTYRRHWVLVVLDMKLATCYYLDSMSSSNVNLHLKQIIDSQVNGFVRYIKWIQQEVQPGGTECGYYMLKFIKEIVQERIEVLVNDNVGGGKVQYTDDDIDEIHKEWLSFLYLFTVKLEI
uniref:Ubiquitin-like protease family profile domain-containing protein n=1 Tax=Lactuca sativa TaxID=4236 RepID=A0A9R1WP27_LACSA|nr:hypothetical protein LSAT_V11C900459010 [Lactuca sativa]